MSRLIRAKRTNLTSPNHSQEASLYTHEQSGGVEGRRGERLASPVYTTGARLWVSVELLEHGPPHSLIYVYQQRGAPGGCWDFC